MDTPWPGWSASDVVDLAAVSAFARDTLAPLVAAPEIVLPSDELPRLLADRHDIWAGEDASPASSTDALREVAAVNGGVAFGLHRAALAERLLPRLGLTHDSSGGAPVALSLTGHWSLGRDALARLLAGRDPNADDHELLADWFDAARHDRVVVGQPWTSLLAVGFDGTGITWTLTRRADCTVQVRPHAHGFDELETSTVRVSGRPAAVDTGSYVEALYLEMLGILAITAGLVDHAQALARDYARGRQQGGAMIDTYPAVQQMLAQISATARAGAQHLSWFATQQPGMAALADLCAIRAGFQPAACVAANNAIQVLGGRGYMQDFGPEKVTRDANTLRVLTGTPAELALFVAEWDRGAV